MNDVTYLNTKGLWQFTSSNETFAAIVSDVRKMRRTKRAELQQVEDAEFEAIDVSLRSYIDFVFVY